VFLVLLIENEQIKKVRKCPLSEGEILLRKVIIRQKKGLHVQVEK
jgi:hypothetical protein